MDENKKFNDLIYRIYNTIDEPHTWQEVLAAIACELDSTHIFLAARSSVDQQPFAFFESGYDQGCFDRYQQHYYSVDIWRLCLDRLQPNKVYASHHVCDDRAFVNSEIFNDFAIPLGVRHGLGSLMVNEDQSLRAEMGIVRSKELGYYDEQIRLRAEGLTPHIRQALSLSHHMKQLAATADDFQQLLNISQEPIFICDYQNQLLQHNNGAERLLSSGELIRVNTANQLVFKECKAQLQFEAIKVKVGLRIHASSTENLILVNQQSAYRLKVQCWLHTQVTALGIIKISALMLVLQPIRSDGKLDLQELVTCFGFTKAEAEVTRFLCQGHALEEIASIRNKSLHTVRQQVKACMHKTRCRSQTELVSKVLTALVG